MLILTTLGSVLMLTMLKSLLVILFTQADQQEEAEQRAHSTLDWLASLLAWSLSESRTTTLSSGAGAMSSSSQLEAGGLAGGLNKHPKHGSLSIRRCSRLAWRSALPSALPSVSIAISTVQLSDPRLALGANSTLMVSITIPFINFDREHGFDGSKRSIDRLCTTYGDHGLSLFTTSDAVR